ncbi:MAG: hypothetical protein NC418_02385 [Muribaculaceae bacterium]|nr:hypothetical protein [Muribaculaceae bacterium]
MRDAYGRNAVEAWICCQLKELSEFSGCKNKFSNTQLDFLSRIILANYASLRLTEFMLFCWNFKLGKYGVFYGVEDPLVITSALEKFVRERNEAHALYEQIEEMERKEERQRASAALWQRYLRRIPCAPSTEAPMDFLQYRLMGFDHKSDGELESDLAKIKSGELVLPTNISAMLAGDGIIRIVK